MNFSQTFILRPVATWLAMLAIVLSGILAYRRLPKAALPQVDYPTIQVVTSYPGAGPDVMATSVTAPLERQFGTIAGLTQMSSTSSAGTAAITLRFELDVSLDVAEQMVQAAINAAASFLPNDLPSPPIYSKVNPADAPILSLAVTSKSLPLTEVVNLVETRVSQKLSQVSGVGLVTLSGGQRPAIRVRANPTTLAARGLGFDHLRQAIAAANSNQAKGNFDGPEQTFALNSNAQLTTPEEYRALIIAGGESGTVRLSDVAEVSDAAEDANLAAWADDNPAILVNVMRQPGANVIEVVERLRTLLPELQSTLPAAVDVSVLTDRTLSVKAALHDTQLELLLAVALVVMVIFVFLRKLSVTLIPSLAVPLSLVGTFGAMYLLGFSINNLTLMALTIATGFVVDDAIVMIENIARRVEEGEPPLEAALNGARQIGFTIVSLTFSLIAVLIPLLFMADVVGRLFREFALTLAVAILISAVVSLTFTPMLCARLVNHAPEQEGRFARASARALDQVVAGYTYLLDKALAHRLATLGVAVGTLVFTLFLAVAIPKGFFPVQDTGIIQAVTEAPPGVSFSAMTERQRSLTRVVLQDPAVESVASIVGVDGQNATPNSGRLLINLKPRKERPGASAAEVARRLRNAASDLPDVSLFAEPVQDLTVDDRVGKAQFQYVLQGPDADLIARTAPELAASLKQLSTVADVSHDAASNGLVAFLDVDRDRAARLGLTMAQIDDSLYAAFGQRFVSTIFTQTSQYRVVLEMHPEHSAGLSAVSALHVTSARGAQIPVHAFARVSERQAPLSIHRERQFPAATLTFNPAPGFSLGQAVAAIEAHVAQVSLPEGVQGRFSGAASAFRAAVQNEVFLILAALVTMYIVLGILYESFIHPLTILSTLPAAGVGALLALMITRTELSVVAIIGIVLLIGIVQKNAILIVDFALEAERSERLEPLTAIRKACRMRFRPILMTTLAALFSAVPLVLGSGPGSELRGPLGITMIGGLFASQLLTLFTTPVVYLAFHRFTRSARTELPEAEAAFALPSEAE